MKPHSRKSPASRHRLFWSSLLVLLFCAGSLPQAEAVAVPDFSLLADGIELMAEPVEAQRYAWISPEGAMPRLQARFLREVPEGEELAYELEISYERSGRRDRDTFFETIPATETWDINAALGPLVRGGRAVLRCTYRGSSYRAVFYLRGRNPTHDALHDYLTENNARWFVEKIGVHESGSEWSPRVRQFNETGEFHIGDDDIRHTPNASFDFGFGIFQLTAPRPTAQQLWSWRANCDAALRLIEEKRLIATIEYNRELTRANPLPIPSLRLGEITFDDQDSQAQPVVDAWTIKLYNGRASWSDRFHGYAGDRGYAQWNFNTATWELFPVNCYRANGQWVRNPYLEKVCLTP